ncbi:MAG: hypothetical protein KDJ52_14570 [Anaerolineae bacterium]|nr:hypothetical protein [Anaerolineae bacterium]
MRKTSVGICSKTR